MDCHPISTLARIHGSVVPYGSLGSPRPTRRSVRRRYQDWQVGGGWRLQAQLDLFADDLHLELDRTNSAADHAGDLGISESLELPDHDAAEVRGETVEQALNLVENDDLFLLAGLRPVDVLEHPAREERARRGRGRRLRFVRGERRGGRRDAGGPY